MQWISVRDKFPPTKILILIAWPEYSFEGYDSNEPSGVKSNIYYKWWLGNAFHPFDEDNYQYNSNYYEYNLINCPLMEEKCRHLKDDMFWCKPSQDGFYNSKNDDNLRESYRLANEDIENQDESDNDECEEKTCPGCKEDEVKELHDIIQSLIDYCIKIKKT